jgi:hypothetical protein
MSVKNILFVVFALFAISLMIFYFIPFGTINFKAKTGNYNFSINNDGSDMQFYPNMRFPDSRISYRISDCPLQKEDDMGFAFDIMENLTSLTFYSVNNNEEISVTCEEKSRIDEDLFIAGEGGPTNITVAGQYNVITYGEILLITDSKCPKPNVAIHELMHVFGFKHSTNRENIMYNITNCDQTIGEDMLQLINNLYSIESNPDLTFKDVSASMSGRFLNVNMTIVNEGLKDAGKSIIDIYTDKKLIKEIDLESLEIGSGRIITLENIFVTQINVNEIMLSIDSNFNEMSKDNNQIQLEIKK